jgi:hypothetical protein
LRKAIALQPSRANAHDHLGILLREKGEIAQIVTANSNGTVSVLLGNGDGTFQPHRDSAAGSGVLVLAMGDFNHDGFSDLAVVAGDLSGVSILLNDGHW